MARARKARGEHEGCVSQLAPPCFSFVEAKNPCPPLPRACMRRSMADRCVRGSEGEECAMRECKDNANASALRGQNMGSVAKGKGRAAVHELSRATFRPCVHGRDIKGRKH